LSGIEVLARMDQQHGPRVLFTTAYDKYALTAFDAAAVDYLLKPFTTARFSRAMARVRERLTTSGAAVDGASLEALLRDVRRGQEAVQRLVADRAEPRGRLVVRNGDRMPVVRHADIEFVEADGNYVKLHAGAVTHRVRGTIHGFLEELDTRHFARVHRGTIANLERVREVQPWYSGDFVLVMQSGAKLRLSRTYNDVLRWFGMGTADIERTDA
jgi:two-component system LytT family response regulator